MKESNIMEEKVNIYENVILNSIVNPLKLFPKEKTGGLISIEIVSWDGKFCFKNKEYIKQEDIIEFLKQNVQEA